MVQRHIWSQSDGNGLTVNTGKQKDWYRFLTWQLYNSRSTVSFPCMSNTYIKVVEFRPKWEGFFFLYSILIHVLPLNLFWIEMQILSSIKINQHIWYDVCSNFTVWCQHHAFQCIKCRYSRLYLWVCVCVCGMKSWNNIKQHENYM